MNDKFYSGRTYPLRGKVYEKEEIVDITEYGINSLTDNVFLATNGNEYCTKDFIYFIVPGDTFEEMYEEIYKRGMEAGKKEQIKRKYNKTGE
jgi:hypothetical protein